MLYDLAVSLRKGSECLVFPVEEFKGPVTLANQTCCIPTMEFHLLNVPLEHSIKNLLVRRLRAASNSLQ
jgi:hypothetical protein